MIMSTICETEKEKRAVGNRIMNSAANASMLLFSLMRLCYAGTLKNTLQLEKVCLGLELSKEKDGPACYFLGHALEPDLFFSQDS